MAEYKFYLKQPAASELVDKLLNVVEEVSPNCEITYFMLHTNSGQINFLGGGTARNVSVFKPRKDPGGILSSFAERPWLDVTGLSLNTNIDFNFSVRTDKGFYIQLATSGPRENNLQAIAPRPANYELYNRIVSKQRPRQDDKASL